MQKYFKATLLLVNFFWMFDFRHRGKMEQMLIANLLSKETVTVIMLLYKNMKSMVNSPDSNRFLWLCQQSYKEKVPFVFVICLHYVLKMSIDLIKGNGLTFKKRQKADNILQKLSLYRSRASGKYTCASQMSAAWSGAGCKRYWLQHELR